MRRWRPVARSPVAKDELYGLTSPSSLSLPSTSPARRIRKSASFSIESPCSKLFLRSNMSISDHSLSSFRFLVTSLAPFVRSPQAEAWGQSRENAQQAPQLRQSPAASVGVAAILSMLVFSSMLPFQ